MDRYVRRCQACNDGRKGGRFVNRPYAASGAAEGEWVSRPGIWADEDIGPYGGCRVLVPQV